MWNLVSSNLRNFKWIWLLNIGANKYLGKANYNMIHFCSPRFRTHQLLLFFIFQRQCHFQELLSPLQATEATSYGYYGIIEPFHHQQSSMMYDIDSRARSRLSQPQIQQSNNSGNCQLSNSLYSMPYTPESTLNQPYNELFQHLLSKDHGGD